MNAFVDGTYLATRDIIAEATFKMFDRDNKGSIEFVDFAITLSKCSSGDKRNRLKFIFDMFDSNKDSFMSRDEFIAFIDIICGPNQRSGSTFYEECSESPSICQTEMDLDHNTNNLHQNKSLASNVYDNSKLFDINGSSQNSHVPIFSRSASDSLPTYEESLKRSKFKLSARNLANFIGKEGQIPFDVFADWAMDHFEVSDILKRFDILPSIHDERNSIKQILSKFPELKLGESWCLLDCKWWEM